MEIKLRPDQETHLRMLCDRMGRTIDDFAGEAILTFMEDYEDHVEAQEILTRIKSGEEDTVPLEELMERYDVESGVVADSGETTGPPGREGAGSNPAIPAGKSSHAA